MLEVTIPLVSALVLVCSALVWLVKRTVSLAATHISGATRAMEDIRRSVQANTQTTGQLSRQIEKLADAIKDKARA